MAAKEIQYNETIDMALSTGTRAAVNKGRRGGVPS